MTNDVNGSQCGVFYCGKAMDGEKLPTERARAEDLGVSRNLIPKALAVMEMEGCVFRKVGSGTYFVKSPAKKATARATPDAVTPKCWTRIRNGSSKPGSRLSPVSPTSPR